MAFSTDGFYYDNQIKRYLLQFMAIFSDLQVQMGKLNDINATNMATVPIHYGDPDRVVASILAENTQNKPIRLPAMSVFIRSLRISNERMHGTGVERRTSYVPVGGLLPDDITVVHQTNPVPYIMTLELSILSSNTDQMLQIVEQIMPLFDPQLTIQTSTGLFDMSRLTSVTLIDGPSNNNPFPPGTDKRVNSSTMVFEMPIYISVPADIKKDYVSRIYLRIGAVSTLSDTAEAIVAELDAENIPYELIASEQELPIK